MSKIQEGAFIFEKKISEGKRVEKLMFCSDTMPLKDFQRVIEIFKSKGFKPFFEAHPKYGSCIVIVQRYEV